MVKGDPSNRSKVSLHRSSCFYFTAASLPPRRPEDDVHSSCSSTERDRSIPSRSRRSSAQTLQRLQWLTANGRIPAACGRLVPAAVSHLWQMQTIAAHATLSDKSSASLRWLTSLLWEKLAIREPSIALPCRYRNLCCDGRGSHLAGSVAVTARPGNASLTDLSPAAGLAIVDQISSRRWNLRISFDCCCFCSFFWISGSNLSFLQLINIIILESSSSDI